VGLPAIYQIKLGYLKKQEYTDHTRFVSHIVDILKTCNGNLGYRDQFPRRRTK